MINLDNRDYGLFYFDENYELEAQLAAIREALAAGREAAKRHSEEIEQIAEKARTSGSQHLVDVWTDECHVSIFKAAAKSAAAVGMLAPFVENLFMRIFKGIGAMGQDVLGHEAGERSERAKAQFWDPRVYFGSKGAEEGLVRGIMQLAEASGLKPHLPKDMEKVLKALFLYRNRMLHSGFEWPSEDRKNFGAQANNWPKSWFKCATAGDEPWVWYMTDTFIARVLKLVDEVLDAAGQHARLHYESVEKDPTFSPEKWEAVVTRENDA